MAPCPTPCRVMMGKPHQGAGQGCAGAGLAGVQLQREPPSLRLPPPAAGAVLRAALNKAAGSAQRHRSWRCFPDRVGGWQRLAETGDLSLVCLLCLGWEACWLSCACAAGGRGTNLSLLSQGHVCLHMWVHTGIAQGCKCTQLTASLESTCFSPQSSFCS